MKHAPVNALLNGRVVGLTQGWMAYSLSGGELRASNIGSYHTQELTLDLGRLRLIDRETGARLVLTPPQYANGTTCLDLAVIPSLVAVLGSDYSINIFQVPTKWDQDDPACQLVLRIPGAGEDGILGKINQIEWVKKGEESLLAIGGSKGVIFVNPLKLGRPEITLEELEKNGHKVLATEEVS